MATIATTTNATPFQFPANTLLDRSPTTGYLYALVKDSTADSYTLYRSTNGGASWSAFVQQTRTGVAELGSLFISNFNSAFWAYRVNESSQDKIVVRHLWSLAATSPAWTSEILLGNPGNGGTPGSVHQGVDVTAVISGTSTYCAVAAGVAGSGTIGATLYGMTITGAGYAANNGIFGAYRQWTYTGSGRIGPSVDIEHTGDGKTSGSPNLWLTFGRAKLQLVKLAWTGSGWSGPSAATAIAGSIPASDSLAGRWDGSRYLMAVPNPADSTTVAVYERNRANSSTTVRVTPTHPTGVVKNCTVSYNVGTGDIRVYAVGTSTTVLYYADFIRATGLWGSWGTVLATAVLGTNGDNYGVRRSSNGNARFDAYTAHSGAPNTLTHTQQSLSYAPSTPTWTTAGLPYSNGGAADVNALLTLDWVFSDPDPADTQSAYAIRRQIGAGAFRYWQASDSTWQAGEVQNSSASTSLNLASGWAAGSDANYSFWVKVWDSASNASAYSSALTVVPSVKANPTLTAPSGGGVIATDHVTATWTVSEQSAYRVQLTGSGVYDSGWIAGSALTFTPPMVLADGTAWTLTLTTKNNEGLASNDATAAFTVAYVQAPAPSIVLTPIPSSGIIRAVITNPAAVGTQPAVSSVDLWRRTTGTYSTVINPNTGFETNLTGWALTGGGSQARDTGTFHDGVASNKLTPSGAATAVYTESAKFPVTQGVPMTATAWIRPNTGNKNLAIYLFWFTNVGGFISATKLLSAPVATAWQFLQQTAQPVPTAAQVSVAAGIEGTPAPATTDFVYVDEVRLMLGDTGATWVRVATGLGTGATYDDWQAVSTQPYEYSAMVAGTNGSSLRGPWYA